MFTIFRMMCVKKLWICFLAFVFVGCASVDTAKIDNLNHGEILKLGHAGLGFPSIINPFNPYPANGITALQKAMDYGAQGVEVDLQMTRDSVLVLFHDMELDATTNLEGCIQDKTWEELQKGEYDLGAFFDVFQSDKILSLDSLLRWFQTFDEYPDIHFDTRIHSVCQKPYKFNFNLGPMLLNKLEEYNVPKEKVLIVTSTVSFIEYLQSIDSTYRLSYEETDDFEKGLKSVLRLGVTSMTIKPKLLTRDKVAEAHKANIEIVTFGGKSRGGNAELIELNPDVIHSNNIRALIDLLND